MRFAACPGIAQMPLARAAPTRSLAIVLLAFGAKLLKMTMARGLRCMEAQERGEHRARRRRWSGVGRRRSHTREFGHNATEDACR